MAVRGKRILAGVLAVALLVPLSGTLGALAWSRRELRRDPMPLLDGPVVALRAARVRERPFRTRAGEDRRLKELELEGLPSGPLQVALSLPADLRPGERVPVLVLLGGLDAGRRSLRHVRLHGRNVLVAMSYPGPADWEAVGALARLPALRAAALAVPRAVTGLTAWIRREPFADPARINLLGFSLGAFFAPASARVAERHGQTYAHLVLAYGGAGLPAVVTANLQVRPVLLRRAAGFTLAGLVGPLEPAHHLPHLRTEALILYGTSDRKVPPACAQALAAAYGGASTVVVFDGPHLDPRDPALMERVAGSARLWLRDRGAWRDAP
jgi:dienelactone hydrolase